MILRCSEEINNMSYAWRKLREQLGDDVDRKVNRMCFIKGRMVSFFFFFTCISATVRKLEQSGELGFSSPIPDSDKDRII